MISEIEENEIENIYILGNMLNKNYRSLTNLSEYINNDVKKIYRYKENKNIFGFISLIILPDEIEITDLFIKKEFRNQKIATKLIEYSKKIYKKNIFLEVSNKNNKAISLYKKMGFEEINQRKKYYSDNSDAIIMKWSI